MRLSLFVLGIFAAIVCIASPASAQYLLMTIGQFPFITEKISEQALIKTALVLLPRPLQTSPGSFAIYSTQSMRLVTHEQQSIAVEVINRGVF
jgi:hypothetical protein